MNGHVVDPELFRIFPLTQPIKKERLDERSVLSGELVDTAVELVRDDEVDGGLLHAGGGRVREPRRAGQLDGVQVVVGDRAVALFLFVHSAAAPVLLVVGEVALLGNLHRGAGYIDVILLFLCHGADLLFSEIWG